ncbi:MAG TPA: L-threonylcarbamoyladenylate synthase [Anaerolineaceae bacterium]
MIATQILSVNDPTALAQALAVLRGGGLVAFPTDTVYGVGALAFDAAGIDRIFEAKGRDTAKAIPILVGTLEQLTEVTLMLTPSAQKLAQRYWPGALTLVVPRHPGLPENLSATPTVGVRMPAHPFALDLLRSAGPLAVTSANLSGQENPVSAQDVLAQLNGRIELVIDGGNAPGGVPSTVVDCTGEQARILRQGAIAAEEIAKIVG